MADIFPLHLKGKAGNILYLSFCKQLPLKDKTNIVSVQLSILSYFPTLLWQST